MKRWAMVSAYFEAEAITLIVRISIRQRSSYSKRMNPTITPRMIKPVATYAAANDVARPLRRQAREQVIQISIWIIPIQSRRLNQTRDRRRPFATAQRSGEEPVIASKSLWPDLISTPIIVYGDGTNIQVARQRCPAFQTVIQRSADG